MSYDRNATSYGMNRNMERIYKVRREAKRFCEEREKSNPSCLEELPLAMAYVPCQRWREIYKAYEGVRRGTIFRELDKPFLGAGGCHL